MNKIISISFIISVLLISFLTSCTPQKEIKALSDLQIEACNQADSAKTCDTRLAELGIVTKEDCCTSSNKCC